MVVHLTARVNIFLLQVVVADCTTIIVIKWSSRDLASLGRPLLLTSLNFLLILYLLMSGWTAVLLTFVLELTSRSEKSNFLQVHWFCPFRNIPEKSITLFITFIYYFLHPRFGAACFTSRRLLPWKNDWFPREQPDSSWSLKTV